MVSLDGQMYGNEKQFGTMERIEEQDCLEDMTVNDNISLKNMTQKSLAALGNPDYELGS